MKCYNCGQFLPEDSEFCQYCGKRLEKQVSIQEDIVEKVNIENETTDEAEFVLPALENEILREEITIVNSIQTEKSVNILKENPKIRFCKFCGSQVDAQTKKCSGCGKQYFRGIKFNKFWTMVSILSIAIIVSVIFNVNQIIEVNEINKEREYHMKKAAEQRIQVVTLKKELEEKEKHLKFYAQYAVIVSNDGSRKYHIYGCEDFNAEIGFWIYNCERAENLGYYACSKCYSDQ